MQLELTQQASREPLISFLIPTYNEEQTIRRCLKALTRALESLGYPFEIIIADDGSNDSGAERVRDIVQSDPRVKWYRNHQNMGRGEVMSLASRIANGRVIAFTDADLSTSLSHLSQLLKTILNGTTDIAIGSRWMNGARVRREAHRMVVSFFYNQMVRFLFGSRIRDHQCGFKAFNADVFRLLTSEAGITTNRIWAWDTELLIRAQAHDFRIYEFPVKWTGSSHTKFRLFRDVLLIINYLFRLRFRIGRHASRLGQGS